jgi:hypothetical protein
MKQYPSIPAEIRLGTKIIGFNKYDGSCIRSEWNKKKGFYKFGTRTRLLGEDEKPFGEAIGIIKEKYERDLSDIFIKERQLDVICFFEFWGPNSAFGMHQDEKHDVTLFDVNYYKKGIMSPREFVKTFKNIDIAEPLWDGNCNSELVELVRQSKLPNMGNEGIVCKLTDSKKSEMFKIKSLSWYARLKEHCNGNEKLYNELV